MPFYRPLTVILMILVASPSIQLIAPGLGDHWFGSDFVPDGWTYAQRFTYLLTELIPVLVLRRHRRAVLVDGQAGQGPGGPGRGGGRSGDVAVGLSWDRVALTHVSSCPHWTCCQRRLVRE